jgi:hypothetical protein
MKHILILSQDPQSIRGRSVKTSLITAQYTVQIAVQRLKMKKLFQSARGEFEPSAQFRNYSREFQESFLISSFHQRLEILDWIATHFTPYLISREISVINWGKLY